MHVLVFSLTGRLLRCYVFYAAGGAECGQGGAACLLGLMFVLLHCCHVLLATSRPEREKHATACLATNNPGPLALTSAWCTIRQRCCSRLQVMLNVAQEAPSAFLLHLEALVGRIQQLWDAGQLREGEKVSSTRVCSMFGMQLLSDRRRCEMHSAAVGRGVTQRRREG
jgi:hypothetical protein